MENQGKNNESTKFSLKATSIAFGGLIILIIILKIWQLLV